MAVALVTGSGGLIGAEMTRFLHGEGLDVLGIDNDMRASFFGPAASTAPSVRRLQRELPRYRHHAVDIRDAAAVAKVLAPVARALHLVVHCAAQPSHGWATGAPLVDFAINATATLSLLERVRTQAPQAVFLFASTNKVYGDAPNRLPLRDAGRRFAIDPGHRFAAHGIDETLTVDASQHTIFGASKLAADIMVQEYARTYGLATGCFRGGCMTGPGHRGAEQHGFLAYLVACQVLGRPYTVYGHGGRQVRDNIHSADYVQALWAFAQAPRPGAVYNLGGGMASHCSLLEAADAVAARCGRPLAMTLDPTPRAGDHRWYVSDTRAFCRDYPTYRPRYTLAALFDELVDAAPRRAA